MNLALIGYGKMGHEIARVAEGKHTIALIVDPNHTAPATNVAKTLADADFNGNLSSEQSEREGARLRRVAGWRGRREPLPIDVAIEFSHPTAVLQNIDCLLERKIPIVVGTTGWYDHLKEVEKKVKAAQGALLWASNFSIGVHLFWKMVERGAELMNHFEEYDVFGHEFHHNQKADSPSGTAKTTADILLKKLDRKTTFVTNEMTRKIEPHELHFSSTRGGSIPGTHSVYFDSPADTIEITHTARSRSGFATGALRCAEWLAVQFKDGKRGLFSIENYLETILPNL